MKDLTIKDIYIGGSIIVFSRQFNIIDYADEFTRKKFEVDNQKTFAMIKPDAVLKVGQILSRIEKEDIVISKMKMRRFTREQAQMFYAEHKDKPFFENLVNFISSAPVIGFELVGRDMIKKWRLFIGPTNCQVARVKNPQSIRALFGREGVKNAVHGSDSEESAERELKFFFDDLPVETEFLQNNISCGIVKPHIFKENKVGAVLEILIEKLEHH